MEKIYGATERQDGLYKIGRKKFQLIYGFGKDTESDESGYNYRQTFDHKPTADEIRNAITSTINAETEHKVIGGFVYGDTPCWLSRDNQQNYATILANENQEYPLQLKLNELEDGTPVYGTFQTADDFKEFSKNAATYIIETVQAGWREKDAVLEQIKNGVYDCI